MKPCIVIPAWNEAEALPSLLGEIADSGLEGEVVVIDDGSTDDTGPVAESLGATVLRQEPNQGIGPAMRRGFAHAVEAGASCVLRMDADGQHPPSEAAKLMDAAKESGADLVVGTRHAEDSEYTGTWDRRLGVGLLAKGLSWIVRQPLRDPASGFQVVSPRLAAWFAEHYPDEYPEPGALIGLKRAGFTVTEVPVRFRPRSAGESTVTGARALRHVLRTTGLLIREGLRGRVKTDRS